MVGVFSMTLHLLRKKSKLEAMGSVTCSPTIKQYLLLQLHYADSGVVMIAENGELWGTSVATYMPHF